MRTEREYLTSIGAFQICKEVNCLLERKLNIMTRKLNEQSICTKTSSVVVSHWIKDEVIQREREKINI